MSEKKIMRSLRGYQVADVEARSYLSRLLLFTPSVIGTKAAETESRFHGDGYDVAVALDKEIDPFAIWYQVVVNGVVHNCYPGNKNGDGVFNLIDEDGNIAARVIGQTAIVYSDAEIESASVAEAVEGSARAKSGSGISNVYVDAQNRLHIELTDGTAIVTTSMTGTGFDEVLVQKEQPDDEYNKLWISDDASEEVEVPTYAEYLAIRDEIDQLYDLAGANNEWDQILQWVRDGKIDQHLSVGDELVTTYTYNGTEYDCPWVVLDIRDCEWEDGTTHPGLWLGMKYATIEDIQFDAEENTVVDLNKEPNAITNWYYWGVTDAMPTYTALNLNAGDAIPTTYDSVQKCGINHVNVLRYGYNRWSHSAMRQWLNSDGDVNTWWTPQHLGDKEPSQLATMKGFMAGLEQDFLSVVKPVKIQTVSYGSITDTTVDKFFLQSAEEMYGSPVDVEGPYFPYWKQATGWNNPLNSQNEARKIRRINNPSGNAVYVWLRSAVRDSLNLVRIAVSTGAIDHSNDANGIYAALPACVIS